MLLFQSMMRKQSPNASLAAVCRVAFVSEKGVISLGTNKSACPDTRKVRDECVFDKGEEACTDLIKAHQDCMRKMGFNI